MAEHQERINEATRLELEQSGAVEQSQRILADRAMELRLLQARQLGDAKLIRDVEWEIALARLRQSDHYKNLLAGLKEGTDEWTAARDLQYELAASLETLRDAQARIDFSQMLDGYEKKLARARKSTREVLEMQREAALRAAGAFEGIDGYERLVESINRFYDDLARRDAWQTFARNATWALGQVNQAFGALSDALLDRMRQNSEAQRQELQQRHDCLVEALERELQARLHAAGLVSAATRQQHAADLAAAKKTGDHRVILEAENAKKRWEMEQEAAGKRALLERELAEKKARIDYELAKANWRAQLAQALISAAQAVLTATASAPFPANLIPIGFATGVGAAQTAMINQNRPRFQPPAFDAGGIVPGNSFSGDRVLARVNSGEMILNREQQRSLFDLIGSGGDGGGDRPIEIHFTLEMDGDPIAEKVFRIGSMGQQFIRARGVVG